MQALLASAADVKMYFFTRSMENPQVAKWTVNNYQTTKCDVLKVLLLMLTKLRYLTIPGFTFDDNLMTICASFPAHIAENLPAPLVISLARCILRVSWFQCAG